MTSCYLRTDRLTSSILGTVRELNFHFSFLSSLYFLIEISGSRVPSHFVLISNLKAEPAGRRVFGAAGAAASHSDINCRHLLKNSRRYNCMKPLFTQEVSPQVTSLHVYNLHDNQ